MTGKNHSKKDIGIETLLDLDSEIFPMENGFWTKFEAHRTKHQSTIPHGIKYSLTLHDRNNTRILGFDNAHAVKPKRKKYGARKVTWDHFHKIENIYPYESETAGQLLEDFWSAVDDILK